MTGAPRRRRPLPLPGDSGPSETLTGAWSGRHNTPAAGGVQGNPRLVLPRAINIRTDERVNLIMTANSDIASSSIRPLLTIPQTAEHLQVSTKSVRRWIESGELVAHRIGRQLRISWSDLQAFVRMRRIG